MKKLFLTTCYPTHTLPQYCIFLQQQAQALSALGHTVEVLHFCDTEAEETVTQQGILVKRRRRKTKSGKLDLLYPAKLCAEDEAVLHQELQGGYDAVSFHIGDLRLFKTVQKLCRQMHIPLLMHFHGLGIWRYYVQPHPLLNAVGNISKKALYRKLDATVSVSDKVRQVFFKRIQTVPGYVVYNGVNCELFTPNPNRQFFQNGEIRILCAANLIPIKGQSYLIEAAKLLSDRGCTVRLTFAGRGPDEQKLRALAKSLSVSADFLGYVAYTKIAELMKTHDLFIMPSYFEALGCVYLEAMASGMLTVGVSGQGIDEIIKDGENGWIAEAKSAASIARIVEQAVHLREEDRKTITQKAVQTANAYTWAASAKSLEAVYQQVVGEKK